MRRLLLTGLFLTLLLFLGLMLLAWRLGVTVNGWRLPEDW